MNIDRDTIAMHDLNGLAVTGLVVRNNYTNKVTSPADLIEGAPGVLEEDVGTATVFIIFCIAVQCGYLGGVFVECALVPGGSRSFNRCGHV
jgi:hypothetical protein